jgi:hypothetical protein
MALGHEYEAEAYDAEMRAAYRVIANLVHQIEL